MKELKSCITFEPIPGKDDEVLEKIIERFKQFFGEDPLDKTET